MYGNFCKIIFPRIISCWYSGSYFDYALGKLAYDPFFFIINTSRCKGDMTLVIKTHPRVSHITWSLECLNLMNPCILGIDSI